MPNIAQATNFYRYAIGILAIYLLFTAVTHFYRYATSATLETHFRDAPSSVYVAQAFPTLEGETRDSLLVNATEHPDSVKAGDLLIAINDKRVEPDSQHVRKLLSSMSDSLKFEIFRPTEMKRHSCLVRRTAIPDSFFSFLSGMVLVHKVPEDGPWDLAGMRVGDLIDRIGGQRFSNVREAVTISKQFESQKTIRYDVIRNNERTAVNVTLPSIRLQLPVLLFFVCGLIFFGVGGFIAFNGSGFHAAQLLGLSFTAVGFFLMMALIRSQAVYEISSDSLRMLVFAALTFGLAFWAESKFYFPQKDSVPVGKPWLRWVPYALATLFVVAFWLSSRSGAGPVVFWAMIISMLGCGFGLDFLVRKERQKEYRKIANVLGAVTGLSCGAVVVLGFLFVSSGKSEQLGFLGLPLAVIPLSYLYSIGHYQLLEMNLHIRKEIQYIVATVIWVSVLTLLLVRLLFFLPELNFPFPYINIDGTSLVVTDVLPEPEVREFWQRMAIIFLSIGMVWAFWRVGKSGQQAIARRFTRQQYNVSRATSEMAEIMATKLGMEELARGIVEKLARLMELKRVGVMFFKDQEVCCCQDAYGFSGSEWDELCLASGNKLIREIKKFRSESRFSIDYLPYEIKEDFVKNGFRHIIPIRFKDKLVGTFMIGEKRSETPFHLEDLTFLAAVARQASIAIENAFLHEELTEQERMKHELNIARRIQMASLPQRTPKIEGLEISGVSVPALEVGGDYFDYLNGVAPGVTVIVGDVSGKGTSAALYMSKVQGIIRSLHAFNLSPRELFIRVNQLLYQDLERKSFITAIGAFIDTKKQNLILARAGHLPLFYYSAKNKQVEMITPKGLGLGLDSADVFAAELEEQSIEYVSGDVFLFVTDGVTEAKTRGGGEFGEDKLTKVLESSFSCTADEIRDRVLSEVRGFVADSLPHDDQTVVVVKVR